MNYELKSAKVQGAPIIAAGPTPTIAVYVNVEAGIVGDSYGFTKTTTELFSMETDSITTALGQIQTLAAAKVAALYPNT